MPVDGLRGAAALLVVIGHIYAASGYPYFSVNALAFGLDVCHSGVDLFFVLSGFCLYYPLTKQGSRRDWASFFRRRARRLGPPYYAALAGVVLLPFVIAPFAQRFGLATHTPSWPGWHQIWPHLTLLHTFFTDTFFGLNGPFWSLGIEVQFYLAFPLAVWLVDRFAWRGVLLIAVVTFGYRVAGASGLLAYQPVDLPDVFLSRWLGFALGMLVAVRIRHSTEQGLGFRRELTVLLGAVSLFLAASYFLYGPMAHWAYQPKDLLFAGVYSALLYLACTVGSRAGQLFARRVPVWIGKISYSLYLVHLPIIFALAPTVLALKLHPATTFAVMLVVGIPVVLTVAALFFHVFERPFLNAPVVREQRSSQRSALSQPLAMPVEHQVRDGARSQNRVTGTVS